MDACGTGVLVQKQLVEDISPYFNGRESMVVDGIGIHVLKQLVRDISPYYFNGRDIMDVFGTGLLVPMQQRMGISNSSNGPEIMGTNGVLAPAAMQQGVDIS